MDDNIKEATMHAGLFLPLAIATGRSRYSAQMKAAKAARSIKARVRFKLINAIQRKMGIKLSAFNLNPKQKITLVGKF